MTSQFRRLAVASGVAAAVLASALLLTWAPQTSAYDRQVTTQYTVG